MTLGKLLQQGGWAMWPIYLCFMGALVIFVARWLRFREIRHRSLPWLDDVLGLVRQRRLDAAFAECERHRHPVAHVLSEAIETRRTRPDRVAAEASRVGHLELQRYERFLPLLSFIAQVAPLLGLLGTVLGMVKMFLGLQQAGMANVNASALASGIWQALLTTAAGLVVAAPTLAAHLYLSSRLDTFRAQLSDAVERLLTALPSEHAALVSETTQASEAAQALDVAHASEVVPGASPVKKPLAHAGTSTNGSGQQAQPASVAPLGSGHGEQGKLNV